MARPSLEIFNFDIRIIFPTVDIQLGVVGLGLVLDARIMIASWCFANLQVHLDLGLHDQ